MRISRLMHKVMPLKNSLHLTLKYDPKFVRRHYLFREANSFPTALEENCELRGNCSFVCACIIFWNNFKFCVSLELRKCLFVFFFSSKKP